jgi:hypothetical protein
MNLAFLLVIGQFVIYVGKITQKPLTNMYQIVVKLIAFNRFLHLRKTDDHLFEMPFL